MVKLLVVDDESGVRNLLRDYFTDLQYAVDTASSGEEALAKVSSFQPHLVFLDIGLPGVDGIEVLARIKEREPTVKIIMITGWRDDDSVARARAVGADDYVTKPFKLEYLETQVLPKVNSRLYEELRQEVVEKNRLNEQLKVRLAEIEGLYDKLSKTSLQTITSLALALESKDQYTHGHSRRVCEYSCGIAEALKETSSWQVDDAFLNNLEREALLHDIGKVGMPDAILHKPDKLTDDEYEVVKKHPEVGARILAPIEGLQENIDVILHHHETYNGTGYPDGLRGDTIPLRSKIISVADTYDAIVSGNNPVREGIRELPRRSRILSVADAYDAMTSGRTYRQALSPDEAAQEIIRCKGTQFDPEVVDAYIRFLKKRTIIAGETC